MSGADVLRIQVRGRLCRREVRRLRRDAPPGQPHEAGTRAVDGNGAGLAVHDDARRLVAADPDIEAEPGGRARVEVRDDPDGHRRRGELVPAVDRDVARLEQGRAVPDDGALHQHQAVAPSSE